MKVHWAILCEKVITDRDTLNITLIDVIDHLQIPSPQLLETGVGTPVARSVWLAVLWSRSDFEEPEKGLMRLEVVPPDEASSGQILSNPHEVDLEEAHQIRTFIEMTGSPFPVQVSGEYLIRVLLSDLTGDEWETIHELPLRIDILQLELAVES